MTYPPALVLSVVRNHPLPSFVVLAYAWSWLCWLPILPSIAANPFESEPSVLLRFLSGAYGPSIAALTVSGLVGGKPAVKQLLRRLLQWRVERLAYAVALLWSPLVVSLSVAIHVALGGTVGFVYYPALLWVPVMFVVVSILGPLGEELGWRGFALPHLLTKLNFAAASLVTGCIWTFWHAPLFWAATGTSISGTTVTLAAVGLYLVSVTASAFVFTWVHQRSRGSVLLAVIAHLSLNGTAVALGFLLPELGTSASRQIWTIGVGVLVVLVAATYSKWATHTKWASGKDGVPNAAVASSTALESSRKQ